ncbi:MAG TPA: hypothetical protein VIL25_11550, partial [Vicinamibacterales bacterium]
MTALQVVSARTPDSRTPAFHAGVRRARLLTRLLECPPFVAIVAPAGYGKTALLSDWSAADPRAFAWVTLHRSLDDPNSLLRSVTRALATAPERELVLVLD